MRGRTLVLAAAIMLSACAFGSEEPFYSDHDGALVFGQGADMIWRERPDGDEFTIRFARRGKGYEMSRLGALDETMRVIFVPITQTPEQDYIAQVHLRADASEGVAYAFVWRDGRGYRVFSDPRAYNEDRQEPDGADQYCRAIGYGECAFDKEDDAIGYYRAFVYPRFVTGDGAPASYLELAASDEAGGAPERPTK